LFELPGQPVKRSRANGDASGQPGFLRGIKHFENLHEGGRSRRAGNLAVEGLLKFLIVTRGVGMNMSHYCNLVYAPAVFSSLAADIYHARAISVIIYDRMDCDPVAAVT
jgi:hypothetical protein